MSREDGYGQEVVGIRFRSHDDFCKATRDIYKLKIERRLIHEAWNALQVRRSGAKQLSELGYTFEEFDLDAPYTMTEEETREADEYFSKIFGEDGKQRGSPEMKKKRRKAK